MHFTKMGTHTFQAALTVLSSPIDGVVAQLKVHTIGAGKGDTHQLAARS
jgi:hypothetical protein